jgi:two-component system, chemotaxis family, protein-glutamate methylesterase/glutaminase
MRVLVVDDTVVYRKLVSEALSALPGVEVAGTAANGRIALSKIPELRPDLVTLDMEMPEMDGIQFLEALRERKIEVGVIVLSAHTRKGGALTMKALELGAFDFITKPEKGRVEEGMAELREAFSHLVKAYAHKLEVQGILKGKAQAAAPLPAPEPARHEAITTRMEAIASGVKPELIAVGISTGGPNALAEMLPKLPVNIGVPILIVQHMPPLFTSSLAESLSAKCALKIKEASEGEQVFPNVVYIAPGGMQMKLVKSPEGSRIIRITDDPPENHCKPSVDYLFRSLAHNFPGRVLSVIMTGMGNDGTMGLKLLKRHGGLVIAQDEASCTVFGMPREAIAAGVVDLVVPLKDIAGEITKAIKGHLP